MSTATPLNRETVERLRELHLSTLVTETDRAVIEAGVMKLVELNDKLLLLDKMREARGQISEARRIAHEASAKNARSEQDVYLHNCHMITAAIMKRAGQEPVGAFEVTKDNQRRYSKTFQRVRESLSIEAVEKQANEILNAAREHRDWVDVVTLPKPAGKLREVVDRFGQYVMSEV